MFNISSFLDKFSKNLNSQEDSLKVITDVILNKTNIVCLPESIKIQNNTLFLDVSPGVKNKIFMNKQGILEGLAHTTPKIIDIR